MAASAIEIADGIAILSLGFVNVYFAGNPGSPWALVDTGSPLKARAIRRAAEARFGKGSRPEAIFLTHGHFDHSANARALAESWNVPIYAHPLEMPYLTGQSEYPPGDPTAPGFMAFVSRFIPAQKCDLGDRLRPLESGKPLPGLPGWQWHHTPGHSPGHVSFFRPEDATLLAGDAFATMNLDSLFGIVSKRRRFSRPPTPVTCDWQLAAASLRKLDSLNPLTFAAGHGRPMRGARAAEKFSEFAYHLPVPRRGRYVPEPARATERGVTYLPPARPDPLPGRAADAALIGLMTGMLALAIQRRRKSRAAMEA